MSYLRFRHIPSYVVDAAIRPEIYEFAWEATEAVDEFVEDELYMFDEQYQEAVNTYRTEFADTVGGFDRILV